MEQHAEPERIGGIEPLEGRERGVALDIVNARDSEPVGLGLGLPERQVEQVGAAARGRCGAISSTARSSRRPVGSPAASRTIRPPNGIGRRGVIPAAASAAVLTQAAWTSSESR